MVRGRGWEVGTGAWVALARTLVVVVARRGCGGRWVAGTGEGREQKAVGGGVVVQG